MFRSYSLNRMLALFTTVGFGFFLLDTILEHRAILLNEWASLIPVVYSALGIFISGNAAARWNTSTIKTLRVYLLIGMLVGAGGVYYHLADDDDEEKGEATTEQENAAAKPGDTKEKDKPPLAPLAFAGLSAVGLLGTSRIWKVESVEREPITQ